MGSAIGPGEESSHGAPRTLGDLLYADKARTPVSEREWARLIECIAKGDQQALRALYERAHRLVFTLVLRLTSKRETAEELTLDVFHDVWRRASAYDPRHGSVVGWIMNQARSRALDRIRFEQRKKRIGDGAIVPPAVSVADDPHAALDVSEQGRLLREALVVLTPDERQVIETAFFSELTYVEV